MEAFHDHDDCTHKSHLALFTIPLGGGVDSSRDQILADSHRDCTHHRRSTRMDRQVRRIFSKKERRASGNSRAMARVETVDGFNRGLVLG